MNGTKSALQIIKVLFYALMTAILGWFLFMQLFGANERKADSYFGSLYEQDSVTWVKPDGTEEEIPVPGKYDVPAGQTMVLTMTLPEDYENTAVAIRSSLQDVAFYVDGELREQYCTKDTRLAGKNSASRYVFCPTSYQDAGKELRIELTTYTANYSGVVNPIYCGNPAAIWETIYNEYGVSTYIAFFILFAALTTILFSITLRIIYHTTFDMEYFGWSMLMGSVWMLGESKIRQILVPNASALAALCFVMIMLCPLPLLFYADSIQNGRHRHLYQILCVIVLADFIISSLLHLTGILDYIETLPIGQAILGVIFVMILIHLFRYVRTSRYRSDILIFLGLLLVMFCVGIEAATVYLSNMVSGLFVGAGMILLLLVNTIRTIRRIQHMEAERQQKELEKEQEQNEAMTLRMMQALSATIESKDEYSRGHSERVAEYAAKIAAELDWPSEEIRNLKNCAYLHDIGKIGIPEDILNKPGKLTETEYNLVKRHTVMGVNILKDITMIPHLQEVTRSHHERYDGTGYPDGLAGEEIPAYARIVAVADSFDAMNSRRIYRNALPPETIQDEIRRNAGSQFDPQAAEACLRLLEDGRLVPEETPKDAAYDLPVDSERTVNKFISDVVTTLKEQEETRSYDLLTGLPARSLGEQLIAGAMQKTDGCLAFLDMDNLKKINDVYGHKAGDKALQKLGALLLRASSGGVACRLGGDEFLLFLPENEPAGAAEVMETLFGRFHDITENDPEIHFAAISAGLCMCTRDETFPDCYSKADKTLYYVKQNGKNQFCFYHEITELISGASSGGKDLKQIAQSLQTSGSYTGALDLNYRDFTRQYEYIHQLVIRNRWKCYLVMVTMEIDAETLPGIESIERALSLMGEVIQKHIRQVDVCTRYSAMQYLVILFQPVEAQIPNIMERIFEQYEKQGGSGDFRPTYEYLAMSETKDA